MFSEEKDGVLEIAGEIGGIPEEEDTSEAPTIAVPFRQYRKEEKADIEEWFFPF
jgi:hypothetical protein